MSLLGQAFPLFHLGTTIFTIYFYHIYLAPLSCMMYPKEHKLSNTPHHTLRSDASRALPGHCTPLTYRAPPLQPSYQTPPGSKLSMLLKRLPSSSWLRASSASSTFCHLAPASTISQHLLSLGSSAGPTRISILNEC